MGKINPGSFSGSNITITQAGLSNDFRITTMDVTDVATLLPAVALASRVAISISNLDVAEILYIGKINVTADRVIGTTSGWEVGPGESFNLDVSDTINLYGITETGVTLRVKILEIS